MIGRLADMASGLNNELISISKYYKFNFRVSVLLLIMVIVFNRMLIPIYGVYGAAAGTTLSLIIFNTIKMIFLKHKMQLQPFNKNSLVVIIGGLAVLIVSWLIPYIINPFLDAFIRSCIIIISYGLLLLWLKPSQDFYTYTQSIIKNKKLY
jgi:O-antigen/teichoic acid export membrane protein